MARYFSLLWVVLSSSLLFVACGDSQTSVDDTGHHEAADVGEVFQITVDVSDSKGYPAVFVDLSERSVQSAETVMVGKEPVHADLWVEPGDPEITGLSQESEGLRHSGNDVRIAIVSDATLDDVTEVPSDVKWIRGGLLGRHNGSMGDHGRLSGANSVYLVRDSASDLYKMTIETVNEQKLILRVARMSE